ncbi:CLPTM1 domain-containing protein [Microsporum canis CBS 113480]|uniref:CLPTM1 domain-containing protein n=1 Tax=Arthroderma otae (strain ATCC MYA-4605 / CBS 113480) TaxID=554155 RepID=C5FKU1_ARTOC|nr:CLPTM1 domain-containing protein [Microsporum canis CBS 113480]EEQ30313.1 CLPTM1 domain-containing protein [Microsporum canis CBS 113480]
MPEAPRGNAREEETSALQPMLKGFVMLVVSQFVVSKAMSYWNAPNAAAPGAAAVKNSFPKFSERPDQDTITNRTYFPVKAVPMWEPDSKLDIAIHVTPSTTFPLPRDSKVLDEKEFNTADSKEVREISTSLFIPKAVQNNETLWAHFFVALSGHPQYSTEEGYSSDTAYNFSHPVNQYLPKKKAKKLRNLLDAANETEIAEDEPKTVKISSFYHPNLTVSFVPDQGAIGFQATHPSIRRFLQLERTGARDSSGELRSHMTELNSTVSEVPLRITLNTVKQWQFAIMSSIEDDSKQKQHQAAFGGPIPPTSGDGSEVEMIKEVLLDTNIYLLITTGVVGVLHSIFEFLAFKNDISHWRKKKDVVGTSVRTIIANVFMQLIIFLYLLDNNENTSWMILAGQGFGIVVEAWKITKSANVRIRPPPVGSYLSFLPYIIVLEDKHKLSETEKKTQEYDEIAFKWLYIAAVPLLIGYAIYSLMYENHKSWYSYVIETLVGSVYAYGFLMMVPSLYINYRLKSVAHMPGKALTYKFLNTFIDDLFAFTIKMPTLHRLATLRDDVIFFIWLYQSWKYKVDYTRVNEFGQGGDDDEEEKEKEKTNQESEENTSGGDSKAEEPSIPAAKMGEASSSAKASSKGSMRKRK